MKDISYLTFVTFRSAIIILFAETTKYPDKLLTLIYFITLFSVKTFIYWITPSRSIGKTFIHPLGKEHYYAIGYHNKERVHKPLGTISETVLFYSLKLIWT